MRLHGHGFGLCAIVGLAVLWPLGCQHPQPAPSTAVAVPLIRVRLLNDVQQVSLKAASPPTVRTASGTSQKLNFPVNAAVPVTLGAAGWQIGTAQLGTGELIIEPAPDGSVSIDGRAYRGHYRLVPGGGGDGAFDVINHVDVESYLKGVLARELMPDFSPEAYKAQAVVARTYAIYETRTAPAGRAWDLYPDERSQVYGGIKDESAKSRSATDDTRGWVIAYGPAGQEKIFKTYFSSCCGGATQSPADAFPDLDAPREPFTEQNVGNRCDVSVGRSHARFSWGPVTVRKDELARRIQLFGKNHGRPEKKITTVDRIDTFRTNAAGRPIQFTITDGRGQSFVISAEDLRRAVNTDASPGAILYSGFVTPVTDAKSIRFENGHGFGHGVGLCQWCAEAEAQHGETHQTIVGNAFKGAKLVKAY